MEPLKIAVLHIRDTREHNPAFQIELDELNTNTVRQIEDLGHDAQLVAASGLSAGQMQQLVDRCDALVIMGGEDVDPSLYNGPSDYPGSGHHERAADISQITAIHHAIGTQTPLLGICRGLQLLNVALGGTLIQHMDNTDAHRGQGEDVFADTHVGFVAEEFAADLCAAQPHRCTHHQAIQTLGAGLQITAMSTDGVIEAVVHTHAPVTAVQWHPEHSDTAGTQLRTLIQRLIRQFRQTDSAAQAQLNTRLIGA